MNNTIEGFQLSRFQERLWSLDQISPVYSAQCAVTITGNLNKTILNKALQKVVERHEILRTGFHRAPGTRYPIQVVTESATAVWREEESGADHDACIERLIQQEKDSLRNFEAPSLLRACLVKAADRTHTLLITIPSLCADSRTLNNLAQELALAYQAQLDGREMEGEIVNYAQFAQWQNDLLEQKSAAPGKEFWDKQGFSGGGALKLPFELDSSEAVGYLPDAYSHKIAPEIVASMDSVIRKYSVSIDDFLLTCWQALLWRLTASGKIVVGCEVDGRGFEELRESLGPFTPALPVSCQFNEGDTFDVVMNRLRQSVRDACDWREYFVWPSVAAASVEPDHFSIGFESIESPISQQAGGIVFSIARLTAITERYLLKLKCERRGDELRAEFIYDAGRFDRGAVERLARQYVSLVRAATESPEAALRELSLLGADERRQLLEDWNRTEVEWGAFRPLHQWFEEQVEMSAQRTAIEMGAQRLSYLELNERANRLARRLRRQGVGPETVVGVLMERSVEMVVGALGTLKAGAAYLPLDGSYPEQRLNYMMKNAGVSVLLTQERMSDKWAGNAAEVICVDGAWDEIAEESGENLGVEVEEENLAYVIYTSGSTGKPKGVMVTQGGLRNYLKWSVEAYGMKDGGGSVLHSPLGFDLTVTGLYPALLEGGRLRLTNEVEGVGGLSEALRRERGLGLVKLTPAHLEALSQWMPGEEMEGRTKALVIGGEALFGERLKKWREYAPGTRLINEYGPTETVVGCCVYEVGENEKIFGSVPIGRPIANTKMYILDEKQEPVGIGESGEIYIGGAGLARGYMGRAEETAERFVPNPYGEKEGERLYRTGDVGRRRWDGEIEYQGRKDQQVKLRGYRIELGEIEAELSQIEGVGEAVVLMREDGGGKRLVGYVSEERREGEGKRLKADELKKRLRERLPEYMTPTDVVILEEMPLTTNGKIERKALPAPATSRPESDVAYVAPRTAEEEALAAIWAEVLGVNQVGTNDNFFALGGDSIRSVRVVALAKDRGFPFTVEDLFQHQTISGLLQESGLSEARVLSTVQTAPFSLIGEEDRERLPADVEDAFPLTMLQAGMLYHLELTSDSPAYHNVNSYHMRGRFGEREMQEAVNQVVARHAALRLSFDLTGYSEPLQLTHGTAFLPVVAQDLRGLSFREQEDALEAFVESERRNPFDLSRPPLMRIHVHLRSNDTYQFSLTELHPVSDGWSTTSMFAEIFNRMAALFDNTPVPDRTPPATSFRDYVALERQALQSEECRKFWDEKLLDCAPVKLPRWPVSMRAAGIDGAGGEEIIGSSHIFKWPTGKACGTRQQRLDFPLQDEVVAGLKRLARVANVPLKSVLLAAHLKVLSILSGQSDILTGLSSNGRLETPGGAEARGIFLNTLPFRLNLTEGSWARLAQQVFDAERELLPLRRYPMAAIQKNWGQEPLSETLFGYLHFHEAESAMEPGGVELMDHGNIDWSETNFTLLTIFHKGPFPASFPHEMMLMLTYDTLELCAEQIKNIYGYYDAVLRAMASDSHGRHESQSFLSPKELDRLLMEWNQTGVEYPREQAIHRLFETQVDLTPNALALVFDDETLTYQELNLRANRLAHYLINSGAGPESVIGVQAERSVDMVVGLLAILKSGGAYLPLDPEYPEGRLSFMIEDAEVEIVLTQRNLAGRLPQGNARLVFLDDARDEMDERFDDNPVSDVTADNLAYVIYTSGSTGVPKGIEIPHRGVTRLVMNTDYVRLKAGDRIAQASNSSFDAATFEIWGALLCGGQLIGQKKEDGLSARSFAGRLARQGVDSLFLTTALFNQLAGEEPAVFNSIRDLLFGGEMADPSKVRELLKHGGPARLLHVYGPTESTTFATWKLIREAPEELSRLSIGRPIVNTEIYILDSFMQPVPIGVSGELYIGGDGLARGYLKRPDLTAAFFTPHPFSVREGRRLYRTGDLARYLPNGDIDFIGRIDRQVKIRGFRIELSEIEAALASHPGVREAAVLAREDEAGEKRLVAYVVGESPAPVAGELRRHLLEKLPDYMTPSHYEFLDALPLTPNGKLNRNALPIPNYARQEEGDAYVAPRTPVEEVVAGIWAKVLGVARVGIHDNFYDLGGHSLQAAKIMARVRDAFQVEAPLRALLEQPTVAHLAARIESEVMAGQGLQKPPIAAAPHGGSLPLSYQQQRLWFMEQVDPGSAAYNISAVARARGPLDLAAFERSVSELVRRHDSLRARFTRIAGRVQQVIDEARPWRLAVSDLSAPLESEREAEAKQLAQEIASRPFDLSQGPLLRVNLLRIGPDDHVLILTMHHIVSDGWSMNVLLHELGVIYDAFRQGQPSPLPELPIQYADYVAWQRDWLQGEALNKLLAYWKRRLDGSPRTLELPADRPRPKVKTLRGATYPVRVSKGLTNELLALSRSEDVTLYMTLLAAFDALLGAYSGQRDIVVGTPIANRDQVEMEGLIGFFINTIVMRADLSGNPTFRELMRRVRETALNAYAHQDLPFEKLVEELNPARNPSHHPVFQVMFGLHTIPTAAAATFAGLSFEAFDIDNPTAKFDLLFNLEETPDGLIGAMDYSTDLFDADSISEMLDCYNALLNRVVNEPEVRLSALAEMVSDAVRLRKTRKEQALEDARLKMYAKTRRKMKVDGY